MKDDKQSVQPVAWAGTDEDGNVVCLGMNQSRRFDTPLYLHPTAQPVALEPLTAEQEREEFEAWFKKAHHSRLDRNMPDKSYNSPSAYQSWEIWQEIRSIKPPLPAAAVAEGMERDKLGKAS